jgi:hypothetical protein
LSDVVCQIILKLLIGLNRSNVLKKNIRHFYKVKLCFKFKTKNKIPKQNYNFMRYFDFRIRNKIYE